MKGTRVLLGLALMVATLAGCSLDGGLSLRTEGDGGAARHATDGEFIRVVQDDPAYLSGDGKTRYQFSQGGQRLTVDGIAYIKAWLCKDTRRAVYRREDAQLFYGLQVSDGGQMIQMTRWSSPQIIRWNTLGWAAHLVEEKKDNFKDNVAGKTFMLREKDEAGLWGLDLLTYSFDDGGNATFTRTPWQKEGKTESHTVANGSDGTKGTVNGQQAKLDTEAWTLTIDGKVYAMDYNDPGPSFLNRVKGATYKRGNISYEFSADGKTLTYTIKYEWYDKLNFLSKLKESGTINYDEGSDEDNVIATYGGGYRVHLTENDTIIKLASVPNASDSSDMRWPADRQ